MRQIIEIWLVDSNTNERLDMIKYSDNPESCILFCMRMFKLFSVKYMYIDPFEGESHGLALISPSHRICFHLVGFHTKPTRSNHLIDLDTGEPAFFTQETVIEN
jgi:hypothetical protein